MDRLKKKIFAAIMISVITISGAASVFAASPTPTASAKTTTTETKTGDSNAATAEPKNVTTAAPAAANNEASVQKKYTTKGGSFGWFLLSVIINAILSFAIGNRFYKMSKKDTRINAEIRALRRDVEEKFANNVGGFSEPEVDIANNNDDYSTETEGIKVNREPVEKPEESAEEIFKKWESQMAAQRAAKRASIRASVTPNKETDDAEEKQEDIHSRFEHSQSYQPRRAMKNEKPVEENPDKDIDSDIEEDEILNEKSDSIKNKAKHIITEIFPFKDE